MSAYIHKQNLHTHTIYCDGKNTPEEIIQKAIELGFDTIGFSGHSHTELNLCWDMSLDNTKLYKKEIKSLKAKYADKINILCGLEYEIFSNCDINEYDYLIGSSHIINVDGTYIEVDGEPCEISLAIKEHFGGNGLKYAKAYYENMANLHRYGNFDIVGHFDLIAKYCQTHNFFDVCSKDYQNIALEALTALSEKFKVFEVNTGAVARGYRTTPYPARFILEHMHKLGCIVALTSDCHNKDFLNYYYSEAIEYIKSCNFKSIGIMKNNKIQEISIL